MELEFVDWLQQATTQARHPAVRVGIGDDAAVLEVPAAYEAVVTTDMVMEGTHFDLATQSPERVGRKALAVNLSDLAAMAAEPVAAFVSLALPVGRAAQLGPALLQGMQPLAARFGCEIAGGDTNCWSGPLVINVTLLGRCPQGTAWLRSGARPGDVILVSGALGGSLLGRHLDFEPRVELAFRLRSTYNLHAGCDLSDGLALDLWRMARASQCGAIIQASAVPIHEDARETARRTGRAALEHALGDGEDFELLLAAPSDVAERILAAPRAEIPLTAIGRFVAEPGLVLEQADGSRTPLAPLGYRHGS